MPNGVTEIFSDGLQSIRTQEEIQSAIEQLGVVSGETFWVFPEDNYSFMVMTIPKAGLYVSFMEGVRYHTSITIPGYTGFTRTDTVVHKLDPKYLPDGYPYTETVRANGLPETTVDTSSGQGIIQTVTDILPGGLFTVTYNGVAYECEAQTLEMDGLSGALLGNGSVMNLFGKDEPFAAVFFTEDAVAMGAPGGGFLMPLDGATSVTLKVEGYNKIVHKMSENLLPNLGATPTVDMSFYNLPELVTDASSATEVALDDEHHATFVKAQNNGHIMLIVYMTLNDTTTGWKCPVTVVSSGDGWYGTCLLPDGTYLKVQLNMNTLFMERVTSLTL